MPKKHTPPPVKAPKEQHRRFAKEYLDDPDVRAHQPRVPVVEDPIPESEGPPTAED